jgi:hypothetical protein
VAEAGEGVTTPAGEVHGIECDVGAIVDRGVGEELGCVVEGVQAGGVGAVGGTRASPWAAASQDRRVRGAVVPAWRRAWSSSSTASRVAAASMRTNACSAAACASWGMEPDWAPAHRECS